MRNGVMGKAFLVVLRLQAVADLLSVVALWGLLAPPAPAGLAHGAVRERHSTNCRSELEALGWWTRGGVGDPCLLGDF